jgi:hypothetical protein
MTGINTRNSDSFTHSAAGLRCESLVVELLVSPLVLLLVASCVAARTVKVAAARMVRVRLREVVVESWRLDLVRDSVVLVVDESLGRCRDLSGEDRETLENDDLRKIYLKSLIVNFSLIEKHKKIKGWKSQGGKHES